MLRSVDLNGPEMTASEMTRAEVEALLKAAHQDPSDRHTADLEGKRLSHLDLSGLDFSGEYDGGGWRAPNYGGVSTFQSSDFQVFVQHPREHHIGAAVIAGYHTKNHWPFEVHHGSADFGAVFELQLAHGFRRAIESGEVGEHYHRPVVAGSINGACIIGVNAADQRLTLASSSKHGIVAECVVPGLYGYEA